MGQFTYAMHRLSKRTACPLPPYVQERDIVISNNDEAFHLHNRKLSTYLNCLANHGFLIEQVVEESAYDEKEAEVFQEGRFYSAARAKLLNPSFIVKARKL